jgi:hypothetical protein
MPVPGGDATAAARNAMAMTAPATRFVAITPSDGTDLAEPARALYIGGAGNVSLVGTDDTGTGGTVFAVTAGQILPLGVRRVRATGTTASAIVALY